VSQLAVFWIFFGIFAIACTVAELVRPARKLDYKSALGADVVAFGVYQLIVFPLAVTVSDPLAAYIGLPRQPLEDLLPLPLRVLMFYLAADLGSYWLHRLMHTRHVWRVHAWHHTPKTLYWLAGVRASIPQQILFNLPYLIFIPLLAGAPRWVFLAVMVEGILRNNWMHMNVTWRSNWIEAIFVTPRYHHLHHSVDVAHRDANFGSLFSIWDRLFRTYRDPDDFTPKKFGTGGKKIDPVRLMVGI
jgi:sterol desaturase/sphingolipid hydroxylase (fatty acid hydroxylase superfamily)